MGLHLSNLLAFVYFCQSKAVSQGTLDTMCSVFCPLYCLMGEEPDCLGRLDILNKNQGPQLCSVKAFGMNTLLGCPKDIVIITA